MSADMGGNIIRGYVRLGVLIGVLGLVVGLGIAFIIHETNALNEPMWYMGCVEGGLTKDQCVKLLHERYKPSCT